MNEVRLTVCFVKRQGWPVLYCIVWTESICHVLTSLELFGSFRFWAWLMKSWHYCSMLGEMLLAMWYSQGTWLEGKEVIWGHQHTCVFSDLYGVKRREGCGALLSLLVMCWPQKDSGWHGRVNTMSWAGTELISNVPIKEKKKKNLVHKIKEEFLKNVIFFKYSRNSYFPMLNLATKTRMR